MTNDLQTIHQITPLGLKALGVDEIAYVKSVRVDGQELYAVYAADGSEMAVMKNRDVAFAAIKRNDMEPYSVH